MKKILRLRDSYLSFINKKEAFNSLFFTSFFCILFILTTAHLLTIIQGSFWVKSFFLIYALGQLLIETLALVVIGSLLKRYVWKAFYYIYIGLIFIFLILQTIESILVKLMDLSLIDAYYTIFGADLANFIELLELTELGLHIWAIIFVALALFPAVGVLFYRFSHKICFRKNFGLKRSYMLHSLLVIPAALALIDYNIHDKLKQEDYQSYKKSLPWKTTFFKVNSNKIFLKSSLKDHLSSEEIVNATAQYDLKKQKKPNIYLFIVESLRSDYVTKETAPHLVDFKNSYIQADTALSSANGTHYSWFSIFHSQYPFYWSYKQNSSFKKGSPPLHMLKKMGYKVHVYTSAQLKFYNFDEVILGKNHELADSIKVCPHYGDRSASDSDQHVLSSFQSDTLRHEKEGHCYLFFLDSTHFNYSWPKDFPTKFTPVGGITWKQRLSNNVEDLVVLKNRYKNSIAFIDDLFHKATLSIKKSGAYEDSIIIFCPDHGEEFKEEGKLFHASHLSSMQTNIPLFYKFGSLQKKISLTSHVDIFPSILHYLDQDTRLLQYFDGQSIFDTTQDRFAVTGRYNVCFNPNEFLLHNGQEYIKLKFNRNHHIFDATSLKILGQYHQGNRVTEPYLKTMEQFQEPISRLFKIDFEKSSQGFLRKHGSQ
ncbi:MAG: sulfatase-like hydrolase/transferase [Chlamydiota bacterium]